MIVDDRALTITNQQKLLNLYREYCDTLNKYGAEIDIYSLKMKNSLTDYLTLPYYFWIPIIHEKEDIGFLIIATAPDCHPDTDYYIAEAYIKEEYRNCGYMLNTIKDFTKKHHGTYCYFVLSKNKDAYRFWNHVIKEIKARPIKLRKVLIDNTNGKDYGFEV